ncbi:unnamed protein product [Ilex paraguariensis]|uniref:Uncharacterized protein n=1 Tax=Ilex paraguariensis TaxID=185542 RepID=A0ABC8TL10_9AQUA
MRIGKSFPPSSFSSVPDLDPQHHRSPVAQQHHLQGSLIRELQAATHRRLQPPITAICPSY